MITIEQLIHIMKNDYDFTFRINFGMATIIVDLITSKHMRNDRGKVIRFMNTLSNYGLGLERNDEEEETLFFTKDNKIIIRITD